MSRPTDDGPPSSAPTRPHPDTPSEAPTMASAVDPEPASADLDASVDRYELRSVLGRGGMGEVRLCRDARIGREVAVKVLLPAQEKKPAARARFLREARVQGQLEHPAIVPVHDLGVGPDGATFF